MRHTLQLTAALDVATVCMEATFPGHNVNVMLADIGQEHADIVISGWFALVPDYAEVEVEGGVLHTTRWAILMLDVDDNDETIRCTRIGDPMVLADAIARVAEYLAGRCVDAAIERLEQLQVPGVAS